MSVSTTARESRSLAGRDNQYIDLTTASPFAKGGKRECFEHPHYPDRCIKVWLPGKEPWKLRQNQSGLRGYRKSERAFDENQNDLRTLMCIEQKYTELAHEVVPKCFGMVETSRGPGLVVEMLRDHDGKISLALSDLLWEHGKRPLEKAIKNFCDMWRRLGIPSRALQVYNVVAQEVEPGEFKLRLIDGFGSTSFIPLHLLSSRYARRRSESKARKFQREVDKYVALREVTEEKPVLPSHRLI